MRRPSHHSSLGRAVAFPSSLGRVEAFPSSLCRVVAFPSSLGRAVALALLALGCRAEPTQLVVVVDSDLPPADVRVVRVRVSDLDDPSVMLQRDFDVGPDVAIPFSFGVTPPKGRTRHRVEVVAEARPDAAADPVVVRRAWVGFVRHQTLLLPLFLGEACRGVECGSDETCDRGRCVDPTVDDLERVRPGEEFGPDGSTPDGGAADGGEPDASTDAGPAPPAAPRLRFPWNGFASGTALVGAHLEPAVRFEPVAGATHYEVAASAACDQSAREACDLDGAPVTRVAETGAELLEGRLPPSSRGAVVWSVRACDDRGCGPFAPPRYLLVGVDPTDLDGDGYGDLAIGAPDADSGNGAVSLLAGPLTTPTPTPLPADASGTQSGGAVAFVGDVNGDAVVDVAFVALDPSGALEVVLGGGMPRTRLRQPLPRSHGGRPAVTGCDLDGDGFSDVVVGFSGADEVWVYRGSASGPNLEAAPPIAAPPGAQGFGAAVACAGDVDGDGLADLLVGAPDGATGSAHLVFGDAAGAFGRRSPLPSPAGASGLGRSVAGLGDLDGDGLAELAVGGRGAVFVYAGGATPATPTIVAPPGGASGEFGGALCGAGDTNGDGVGDLVVGAPGVAGAMGRAFLMAGPDFLDGVELQPRSVPGLTEFGRSVAGGGDIDADGLADVAVGCPSCRSASGTVFHYAGNAASSALASANTELDGPTDRGARFGAALATPSP